MKQILLTPQKILTTTDLTHPGMHDDVYLQRRHAIAKNAADFRLGNISDIPNVEYTNQEHNTWSIVTKELEELHHIHANEQYKKAKALIQISTDQIPQMKELSNIISAYHGMRLAPIEGLVDSKTFLSLLASKTMFCTQYIRHHSAPFFTPEPDVIHEFMGHVPTFLDKDIVELSMLIGLAAKKANDGQLKRIERIYWFTLEYGLIEENSNPKLFGAGLLGGISDMKKALSSNATIYPFSIDQVIETEYDFDVMQPFYFIVPSFAWLKKEVKQFIEKEGLL